MKYADFVQVMSSPRMQRYCQACGNDTRKAMTLYRLNLKLSQESFTIISCFEIAIRNAIDKHYKDIYGNDWLRNAQMAGGIFSVNRCRITRQIITSAYNKLGNQYTHNKLVAEMDFGFWRFLFAQPQFYAAGQSLLRAFPSKPTSTPVIQYNHTYVFNEMGKINKFRNRIAHHEPICFRTNTSVIDSTYIKTNYQIIQNLFSWLSIDASKLLFGLDHIQQLVNKLENM